MIKINNKEIQMPQEMVNPELKEDPNGMPIQQEKAPEPGGQPQMTPEEMAADLDQLMEKVQERYQGYNSQKIQVQNNVQSMQEETLNKIFEVLASAGVDGTDPDQVNAFLDKLKSINPELYQMFSDAIGQLMGGDMSVSQGDNQTPPELPVSNEASIPENPAPMPGQESPMV